MKVIKTATTLAALLFFDCGTAFSQQVGNHLNYYPDARDKLFWPHMYPDGGETFYCELPFSGMEVQNAKTAPVNGERKRIWVEHVYASSWIEQAKESACNDAHKGICEGAGDLHNLWPALRSTNQRRSNHPFGNIAGESKQAFPSYCDDFEFYNEMVEPRDDVKGDVARSILYMMEAYDLPLPKQMKFSLLMKWHRQDPPDAHELWRRDAIFGLQGTDNAWLR
ncbi:MAG: endonuclease [Boseongicola sp.]|nr:endonuclease [Boseongicola sp.]